MSRSYVPAFVSSALNKAQQALVDATSAPLCSLSETAVIRQLTVRNPTFWLRVAAMGDLGFAEAYMYGEVECDDLIRVFMVFLRNSEQLSALGSGFSRFLRIPQKYAGARIVNTITNARSNISAHYDISNAMFMGFLSKDMTYSSAIFPELDGDLDPIAKKLQMQLGNCSPATHVTSATTSPPALDDTSSLSSSSSSTALGEVLFDKKSTDKKSTRAKPDTDIIGLPEHASEEEDPLYQAQMRKLRHIIRKADIRPGHRVLEIGSGWGSMSMLIATSIPGTTVDTLTLSVQQAALARERIRAAGLGLGYGEASRVRVHLMDYRAMPAEWEGKFDRVVSIEMIEAVGQEYLGTYWEKIDWALKKDTGVGVIQGITLPEARFDAYVRELDFIRKWVLFPGGFLPTFALLVETMTRASHGRLVVESASNIGPHYARTLRDWRERFEARFEDIVVPALKAEHQELTTREDIEVFRRKWIFYYAYCEIGFTARLLGDHIITFTREGNVDYGCQVFE
ncbi:cyclopropane-fatty-acyl-phospholipid synthase [Obba rivulosa]|uniref:Cyclopropane-fatty-acyl-phospholipid synthase n=1 Tax=Obba rivulosa TaxID=1052685 RepID=A0A8E2DIH8_9APHY|nr:cyclopropane-fatty-acyl-phospholipid synthase [Obba rivulosa]